MKNDKNHYSIGSLARDRELLSSFPIVCVSHGFQTNYERGFCNGLVENGAPLTLISSDRTDTAGLASAVRTRNLRGSQEESRTRWQKALNMLSYHLSLMAYAIYRRRSIMHVIGLIDPALLCGILEGLLFRLVNRRYVLTVHNLLPHDRHTYFNRICYGISFRIAHQLVVHTECMKRDLTVKFGIDSEKILVMEHGIEPATDANHDWGDERQPGQVPMILIFGKIAPYKGVDLLVEALRSVSFDFRLVIAGACPSSDFRLRLQSLIANHPFRERIEWRDGFVAESDMDLLFKDADLVALPYRHIDQSGVLFQALRFGVPVLATRVGQFAHYVTNDVGEVAEPDDLADLGLALERWAARRESFQRSEIREIGRSYEWPVTVRALSRVYR